MFEISIIARGGQGAKIGAEILAEAYLPKFFAQSSPKFGIERRGALIEAYVRFQNEFINKRGESQNPDAIAVFDASLINKKTFSNLKNGGWIIINIDAIEKFAEYLPQFPFKLATINADGIAKKNRIQAGGQLIVNIIMLGAINAVLNKITVDDLLQTIRKELPEKMGRKFTQKALEKNIAGAKEANESVKFWTETEIKNFAKNTANQTQICFNPQQPDEKCTGCKICIELCPKGVISLNEKRAVINYKYCNNCEICEKVCPQKAIKSGGEK